MILKNEIENKLKMILKYFFKLHKTDFRTLN